MRYFAGHPEISVALILTNNPKAGVIEKAAAYDVDCKLVKDSGEMIGWLRQYRIDLVVLAGYLALIPEEVIDAFPRRIINIHPALLPKYGGKGMYGKRVHEN